jgi:hypothetical protein
MQLQNLIGVPADINFLRYYYVLLCINFNIENVHNIYSNNCTQIKNNSFINI